MALDAGRDEATGTRLEEAGPADAGGAASAPPADRLDPAIWRTSAVVLLGPLMSQIDSTVVNVSLPAIRQDLHASIGAVQWVISGYLLALALVLPLNAWLIDRLGAKRLYMICFSAFTAASLLCGATRSIEGLICARVFQGMSGGLLAPMAQTMMARVAGPRLSRVMGYTAMPVLIAPILGPTVAGLVLKAAGWPWLFYINLPIGVLAVVLAAALLPADEHERRKRPFDLKGFLLVSPALAALLYGLDHAPHATGFAALAIAALLTAGFVRHARRKQDGALIDVRLFSNRVFTTAAVTQFLSNGAAFGGQMLLPLFLIAGHGFSASAAGLILTVQGLGMLCAYPSTGHLTGRFGCRPVAAGGALMVTLSTLPLLWMTFSPYSSAVMAAALFLRGLGQGLIGVPTISAAYSSAPRPKIALATTASNIVQRIGGPTATTVMGIVLAWSTRRHQGIGPETFTAAFLALLGLQLVMLAAASRLPLRLPHDERSPRKA